MGASAAPHQRFLNQDDHGDTDDTEDYDDDRRGPDGAARHGDGGGGGGPIAGCKNDTREGQWHSCHNHGDTRCDSVLSMLTCATATVCYWPSATTE